MKLVYIAGPYRGKTQWDVKLNIDTAMYYAGELVKQWGDKGYYPVVPHSNTAHMDGLMPDKYFLDSTMEQLRRCDYIYLCPNWESSEGCKAEKKEAERLEIPEFWGEL
jgi:hypothetical protein